MIWIDLVSFWISTIVQTVCLGHSKSLPFNLSTFQKLPALVVLESRKADHGNKLATTWNHPAKFESRPSKTGHVQDSNLDCDPSSKPKQRIFVAGRSNPLSIARSCGHGHITIVHSTLEPFHISIAKVFRGAIGGFQATVSGEINEKFGSTGPQSCKDQHK